MKKNIFDRIISAVSPATGIARAQARMKHEFIDRNRDVIMEVEQRKYDAASKGRIYSDWHTADKSVNQEVHESLSILRNRSRDLCRNNAHAINAVRTIKNNVVGTGIIPTPKAPGMGKNQLKAFKAAWEDWAGQTACDYDDTNTFYGLQGLIMRAVVESGECLIRRVRGSSTDDVPLRLQVLEGDYIDSTKHNGLWQTDGTITYYGIKFYKNGRRAGYWIYKNNPNEFGLESEFIDAAEIIHVYDVERPGQMRGVPFSCGVMTKLKDLGDYEFTELMRAKIASSFAVFIKDASTIGGDITPGKAKNNFTRITPGMIGELGPGQEIQVATPPSTDGFGEFVKSNLRSVSAGFGTSYETLTNDYSNVNFSSGRMGWIEMHRHIEHLQWNLLIPRCCDKIYPWFVEACQLKGVIPFSAKVRATWTAPRREMIDPYKEVQAIEKQLRAGLISWQDVVKMYGYIPDDLIDELKQDSEMWDHLGLKPTIDPRFDSNRPPDDPELLKDEKT